MAGVDVGESYGNPQGRNVVARPYAGRLYVLLHNEENLAMTRDQDWVVTGRVCPEPQRSGNGASGQPGRGATRNRQVTGNS